MAVKAFSLRLSDELTAEIDRQAGEEHRSRQGYLENLLEYAVPARARAKVSMKRAAVAKARNPGRKVGRGE